MNGGIAVLRTDTLYGIVARVGDGAAVKRVFQVKARDDDKALIVLIARAEDAYDGADAIRTCDDVQRPTSVIVSSPHAPTWLRHVDGTVAYRVPKSPELRELLRITGPLVAPSANPQGLPPARNIDEACAYFGSEIDYYADGGDVPIDSSASRIVRVSTDGEVAIIRE